jgi:hypothetical protein
MRLIKSSYVKLKDTAFVKYKEIFSFIFSLLIVNDKKLFEEIFEKILIWVQKYTWELNNEKY